MTTRACPCCGQLILEPEKYNLTPKQRRIFTMVQKAMPMGLGASVIFDRLYADDLDGGPDSLNIIGATVHAMNKRLALHGIKVWAGRGGQGPRVYRIIPLPERKLEAAE